MNGTTVLVHGLGPTPLWMAAMAIAARRRGYRVINWHYASKRRTIAENAEAFARGGAAAAERLGGALRDALAGRNHRAALSRDAPPAEPRAGG